MLLLPRAGHQKGEARDGCNRAGLDSVQLRFATGLTSEEYVKQKAWLSASLEACPNHPMGGCSFARHSAYERVEPVGAWIARFYCPESHTTFSLLPDCLASGLSSTMAEMEMVATAVESRETDLESAAERLRPDIGLQGALRWLRRRVMAVTVALLALKGLRPDLLAGREPSLSALRAVLGIAEVLPAMRELAGRQVTSVPRPVGLGHRLGRGEAGKDTVQQRTGPDPPGGEV